MTGHGSFGRSLGSDDSLIRLKVNEQVYTGSVDADQQIHLVPIQHVTSTSQPQPHQ
jgi:hypothetical protein